jgi:hypothetical protein
VLNCLEPDIVASTQFFEIFVTSSLDPQRRLMLAVLNDAIDCFQQYSSGIDGKSERLFREAKEWIFENESDWPFSFENICDTLHFDPAYIRKGLAKKWQLSTAHTADRLVRAGSNSRGLTRREIANG